MNSFNHSIDIALGTFSYFKLNLKQLICLQWKEKELLPYYSCNERHVLNVKYITNYNTGFWDLTPFYDLNPLGT